MWSVANENTNSGLLVVVATVVLLMLMMNMMTIVILPVHGHITLPYNNNTKIIAIIILHIEIAVNHDYETSQKIRRHAVCAFT